MALLTLSMTDSKKHPIGPFRVTFFLAEKLFFCCCLDGENGVDAHGLNDGWSPKPSVACHGGGGRRNFSSWWLVMVRMVIVIGRDGVGCIWRDLDNSRGSNLLI